MTTDCTVVCEVIIDMLLAIGFNKKELDLVDDESENHDAILEALSKTKLVRKGE
jgi:hypothetical protein